MIPLLFISNQSFTGKSSLCVGIGKILIEKGYKIGYMKPIGTIPVKIGGITVDEDANYISKLFSLEEDIEDISPIVLTQQHCIEGLKDKNFSSNFINKIKKSYEKIKKGKDLMLLEGGKSIEDGLCLGISSREICKALSAKAVVIMKYGIELIDQTLFYNEFFKDNFGGIIINLIPNSSLEYVKEIILPFLKSKGIKVFGCITLEKILSSVSIKEMAKYLDGKVLCAKDKLDELVESFMLGAMGQEQALKFFRLKANKAVITGGDRADVQLAALETHTKCIVITGNFQPSSIVLGRAEELGVPMILVRYDTLTAVEKLNEVIGHAGFYEFKKIDKIIEITKNFIDLNSLIKITKS
jgi:BioD-like phosphotransacetylase family protein